MNLNVRWKTITLLKDNIEENLYKLGYNDDCLDTISKTDPWKEK